MTRILTRPESIGVDRSVLAEQIIVLKSVSDRGQVMCRGSIDDPKTRDFACQILEGSEEAFRRRANIYGIVD